MTTHSKDIGFTSMLCIRDCCPGCFGRDVTVILEESFESSPMHRYFVEHYQGRASTDNLAGHVYQLMRCNQCGLAYQRAIPDEVLLADIYDRWIPQTERERLQRNYALDDYRYWAEQIEFLIQYLDKPPHAITVLDYGFGWAEWASMARAYGLKVIGTELSHERAEHARKIGITVIESQNIPDHRFDFINTEQVFEHLVDPHEVLQVLSNALSEDGLIKISVPNSRNTLRKITAGAQFGSLSVEDIMPIAPLEHVNSFDNDSLVAFTRNMRLKPVRPDLVQLWNSSSGWWSLRRASKLIARAWYRHIYPRSTFAYFAKVSN